jgi:uncharacterized pyridoxal phosphate-containing UPF0001 family protein
MTIPAQSDASKTAKPSRTIDQIEAEMDKTRNRLAATVTQISEQAKPANLVKKQLDKAQEFYFDAEGKVKPQSVGMTVGAVLAVAVGSRVVRKSFRLLFGGGYPKPAKLPKLPKGVVYVPIPKAQIASLNAK